MSESDFLAIAPITTVAVFALLAMLADALAKRNPTMMQGISLVGLLGGIGMAIWTLPMELSGFFMWRPRNGSPLTAALTRLS